MERQWGYPFSIPCGQPSDSRIFFNAWMMLLFSSGVSAIRRASVSFASSRFVAPPKQTHDLQNRNLTLYSLSYGALIRVQK